MAEDVPAIASGIFDQGVYSTGVAGCGIVATIFMESGVDDLDYQNEARLISRLVGTGDPVMLGVVAGPRPKRVSMLGSKSAGASTWWDSTAFYR